MITQWQLNGPKTRKVKLPQDTSLTLFKDTKSHYLKIAME